MRFINNILDRRGSTAMRKTLAMAAVRFYLQVGLVRDLEPKGFTVNMAQERSSLHRSLRWASREGVSRLEEGGAKIK